MSTDFYVAGGALKPNTRSYVERQADEELKRLVLKGQFCYILTPRQMGKSSLMSRTALGLKEQGVRVAIIDLTRIGSASLEQWYVSLLTRLKRQLRLQTEPQGWWQAQAHLSPVLRFSDFLRDVVLGEVSGQIVIFIDEIDKTLDLDFRDDFFAAIRAIYNSRAHDDEYQRLTFVLLGVASPPELIKNPKMTPFNIGQGIELESFSRSEAKPLAEGLESVSQERSQELFDAIYQWTEGYPYLMQKLGLTVTERQDITWNKQQLDGLVEELFLSESALRSEPHLKFIQDRVLHSPQRRQLLRLYRQILTDKQITHNPQSLLQSQLKLSGLVKTEDGHLKVRNKIYRQVFDVAWINAHTAIDWVRMVATVAILLVVLLVSVLAQSTWAGMRKQAIRDQFHDLDTTPTEKIELLHELFGLRAYIPAQDYDEEAKETFHSLPPAEQEALFRQYDGQYDPLLVVVDKLSPTLADVQGDGSTQPVLEAMYHAIEKKAATKQEEALKEQLHHWLAAQEDFHDGKRQEAFAHYNDAFEKNPDQPNPAILFERARARLLAQSGQDEEALQDFEWVLAIADNEKSHLSDDATPTATPSPTWTPLPSATPTIANTPTASSPPTETEEGGNEAIPDAPILPEPIAPLPTEPPLPPNSAQFYSADRMRRAVSEFILDNQDNQRLIKLLNDAPDSQYPFLRSVITLPFPVVLAGTPIAQPIEAISTANAGQVTQLARWGNGGIREVAYSPDGQLLAVAASIGIYLYDAQTLEELRFIETGALSIAFSADGQQIASASEDGTVRLWRVSDGQLLNTLAGHSSSVSSVAFSADGKLLASGSFGEVRLWSTEGQLLNTLTGHFDWVGSVAFSADGKLLASGTLDGTVRLWSTEGQLLNTLERHSMWSMAFSADGKRLASGSEDGTVRLWSTEGQLLNTLAGHSSLVWSVAFSADGKLLASGSQDSTVRLWSTEGQLLNTLEGHSGRVLNVAFSADGKRLASGSNHSTVRLWQVSDGQLLNTLQGHSDSVWSVAFSADGQQIASGSVDGTVHLWSTEGQLLNTLAGHSTLVLSIAFSADGKRLASGSDDGTVRLWSTEGQLLNTLAGHSNSVLSVAFSADGQLLASGSFDRTVRLWSTEGQLLNTLEGHSDSVSSVAFSADGQLLVSGSNDGTIRLWGVRP